MRWRDIKNFKIGKNRGASDPGKKMAPAPASQSSPSKAPQIGLDLRIANLPFELRRHILQAMAPRAQVAFSRASRTAWALVQEIHSPYRREEVFVRPAHDLASFRAALAALKGSEPEKRSGSPQLPMNLPETGEKLMVLMMRLTGRIVGFPEEEQDSAYGEMFRELRQMPTTSSAPGKKLDRIIIELGKVADGQGSFADAMTAWQEAPRFARYELAGLFVWVAGHIADPTARDNATAVALNEREALAGLLVTRLRQAHARPGNSSELREEDLFTLDPLTAHVIDWQGIAPLKGVIRGRDPGAEINAQLRELPDERLARIAPLLPPRQLLDLLMMESPRGPARRPTRRPIAVGNGIAIAALGRLCTGFQTGRLEASEVQTQVRPWIDMLIALQERECAVDAFGMGGPAYLPGVPECEMRFSPQPFVDALKVFDEVRFEPALHREVTGLLLGALNPDWGAKVQARLAEEASPQDTRPGAGPKPHRLSAPFRKLLKRG